MMDMVDPRFQRVRDDRVIMMDKMRVMVMGVGERFAN